MTSKKRQPMVEVPLSSEYLILDASGEPLARARCPAEGIKRARATLLSVAVIGFPSGVLLAHIFHGPVTDTRVGARAQAAWRNAQKANPPVLAPVLDPVPEKVKSNPSLIPIGIPADVPASVPASALASPLTLFPIPRRIPVSLEGTKVVVYTVIHQNAEEPFSALIGIGAVGKDGTLDLQLSAIPMSGVLKVRPQGAEERFSVERPPTASAAERKPEAPLSTSALNLKPEAPSSTSTLDASSTLDARSESSSPDAKPTPGVKPTREAVLEGRRRRRNERRKERRRLAREAKVRAKEALGIAADPAPKDRDAVLQARRDRRNDRRRERRRLAREEKQALARERREPPRESGVHVTGPAGTKVTTSVA